MGQRALAVVGTLAGMTRLLNALLPWRRRRRAIGRARLNALLPTDPRPTSYRDE